MGEKESPCKGLSQGLDVSGLRSSRLEQSESVALDSCHEPEVLELLIAAASCFEQGDVGLEILQEHFGTSDAIVVTKLATHEKAFQVGVYYMP
jgi:hypothetical protein